MNGNSTTQGSEVDDLRALLKSRESHELLPVSDELRDVLLVTIFDCDPEIAYKSERLLAEYNKAELQKLRNIEKVRLLELLAEKRFDQVAEPDFFDLDLLLEIAADESTPESKRARVFLGGRSPEICKAVREAALATGDAVAVDIALLADHPTENAGEEVALIILSGDTSRMEELELPSKSLEAFSKNLSELVLEKIAANLISLKTPKALLGVLRLASLSDSSYDAVLLALSRKPTRNIINSICEVWRSAKSQVTGRLLHDLQWISDSSREMQVLTALNCRRFDAIAAKMDESVPCLLAEYQSNELGLASAAIDCLRKVKSAPSLSVVADAWLSTSSRELGEIVRNAKFVSGTSIKGRVATAILTKKWDEVDVLCEKALPVLMEVLDETSPLRLQLDAREYLRNCSSEKMRTALWQVAASDANSEYASFQLKLRAVLYAQKVVCSNPPELMVLSHLLIAPDELIKNGDASIVAPCLKYVLSSQSALSRAGRHVLERLTQQSAIDQLVNVAIAGDKESLEIIRRANHVSSDDTARAAYLVISGQVSEYLKIDADGSILAAKCESLPEEVQKKIVDQLRSANAHEQLNGLLVNRMLKSPEKMNSEEWETVFRTLMEREDWPRLWESVTLAPARVSHLGLRRLALAKCPPPRGLNKENYERLLRIGRGINLSAKVRMLPAPRKVPERGEKVTINSDGTLFAICDETGSIRIRSMPDLYNVALHKVPYQPIKAIHFSEDDRGVFALTQDSLVEVAVGSGDCSLIQHFYFEPVSWHFKGDFGVVLLQSGDVLEFDLSQRNGACRVPVSLTCPGPTSVTASDGGKWIGTYGGLCCVIRRHDRKVFEFPTRLPWPTATMYLNDKYVITTSRTGELFRHTLAESGPVDGKKISCHQGIVGFATWSGNSVLTIIENGSIVPFDIEKMEFGEPIVSGPPGVYIAGFATDRQGYSICTISRASVPTVWTDCIQVLSRIPGHKISPAQVKILESIVPASPEQRRWIDFLRAINAANNNYDIEVCEDWDNIGPHEIEVQ